jgi:hypothetical protein
MDFYENVFPFDVHSSSAIQENRIRLDIIFNVRKVVIVCYFPQ